MIVDRDVAEDGTVTYHPGPGAEYDVPTELYEQWNAARDLLDDLTEKIERHLITSDQIDPAETDYCDDLDD